MGRLFFCVLVVFSLEASAAPLSQAERGAIWAKCWESVRQRFVGTEQLYKVRWESSFETTLRDLENEKSDVEFWRTLRLKVCELENGRTRVKFPTDLPRVYDLVPINMMLVGEKILVRRLSSSPEVQASGVKVGDELISVDGVFALDFLRTDCVPHVSGSREHARMAAAVSRILTGIADSRADLRLRRPDGGEYSVNLFRTSGPDNKYFRDLGEPIGNEVRMIDKKYLYVNIRYNFVWNLEQVILDNLNAEKPPSALLLDFRETDGGIVSDSVLARLAFLPLPVNEHRVVSWDETRSIHEPGAVDWKRSWDTVASRIIEPASRVFSGSVIALVSPETSGPAEQFLEPLVYTLRATLVGDTTAGAGHSFTVLSLGNGASLSVAVSEPLWEDGYGNGRGFPPNVFVRPTAAGLAEGRDEVLDKAIEFLESK